MTTCSSMTCLTPRPYLRLAFSTITQIPSSPWPKSCIQETTAPTWHTTLYIYFTRRVSCSGCTHRTLMAWKDVRSLVVWHNRTSQRRWQWTWCACFLCLCLFLVAGIPPEMLVEAHGTFATATCTACLRKYEGEDLRVSQNALLHKNDSEFFSSLGFFLTSRIFEMWWTVLLILVTHSFWL